MHDWQNMGYQKQQFLQAHESQNINKNGASCSVPHTNYAECPFQCGYDETPFHYMQCNNKILSDACDLGIEKFEKSLYKMRTSPPLQEAILHGILCWEAMTEFDLTAESHPLLFDLSHTQLLQNQREIGWDKLIKDNIVTSIIKLGILTVDGLTVN
jgi:hypothetical protein